MFRVRACRQDVSSNLERIHAASACACSSGCARPDNLTWLGLHCLCLHSFLGTAFGARFGDRFWIHFWQFWVLLIRNKRHAPNSVPILVPVLGPVLGILEPILGTNLEHFCLLGCWLLKLVVLEHLVRATFLCQRLFLHRLFEGRGAVEVFHSRGCKHALSCQALPLLRGYADVVRGFLLFLGPNLGPRKQYAGEFSFLYTCDFLAAACLTRPCQPS